MTERRGGFGRWACDTSVRISGLLWPRGTAGWAFALATQRGDKQVVSEATPGEPHHVPFGPKLDRFATRAVRCDFLAGLLAAFLARRHSLLPAKAK